MSASSAKVIPVILSGGSGSRLWPKSRKAFPKQLHKLYGDSTMLQETYRRVSGIGSPVIICNEAQRFMVADQLVEAGEKNPTIILEPVARNTAPAVTVAALKALQESSDAIIIILPADHQIKNQPVFNRAIEQAILTAQEGCLVAFGIVPKHPETGYGYIKASSAVGEAGGAIDGFVEKPDLETAKTYVDSGEYFWNSGMFVFHAKTLLKELRKYEPELVRVCEKAYDTSRVDLDFIRLNENIFSQNKDISIDYAVMEKTDKAWCIPIDCGWSDLGSWQAIWENAEQDENNNAYVGDVIALNCEGSLFHGGKKLISAIGLKDIVVVDTDDALLVMNKNDSQSVKNIVEKLKKEGRSEYTFHREVHRPWGCYDSVDSGKRFQVKRIEVKPGACLSLQMHHHRAEHWVVVTGTALVQRGEEEILLTENQSVYIPLGEMHRLTNPGKVPLQLIEVQVGSYLGEDDIVRYDDVFGRN